MISLQELEEHLNDYLECSAFKDFCHNGLQVQGRTEIGRVATAVTASIETIEAAIEDGADALIVHHGLFWNRDLVRLVGPMRTRAKLLLDHGISLLAYHLPLDAHPAVGNNWAAGIELGLNHLERFGLFDGKEIGVRGHVKPTPVDEWVAKIEGYYGQPGRLALGGKKVIEEVAIISGGGHCSLEEAANSEIDFFISGTGDEPNWHIAHERQINFAAMGHAATEKVGPRALGNYLKGEFGLEVQFLDLPNPF